MPRWVMGVLGCYVGSSILLFHNPHLLHPPKPVKFQAQHISHRGGAGERYENTMEAFRHAVSLGTNMLELDCQLTRDGHVVVAHDDKLDRVAGLAQAISELTLDQLPEMQPALEIQFDPGLKYENNNSDRRFASLRQVFTEFQNLPINIDIKVNNDELIQKVSDLVVEFDREDFTVWGNKDQRINDKCFQVNSNIALICSQRRVLLITLLFYTGLLPFVSIKEQYFEVPMPSIVSHIFQLKNHKKPIQQFVVNILDSLLMRPSLFKHLKKRGIQTYVWVLNHENEFQRAFDEIGADGVMTDYPSRLRDYLLKHQPKGRL